jgi:hypothetical protein
VDASICTEEGQATEEGAVGIDNFVLVVDVIDSNKVVVVVFVLFREIDLSITDGRHTERKIVVLTWWY